MIDSSLSRKINNVIDEKRKRKEKRVARQIIDGHGDSHGIAQGVLTLQRANGILTHSPVRGKFRRLLNRGPEPLS